MSTLNKLKEQNEKLVLDLLSNPDELLKKKPFKRECVSFNFPSESSEVYIGQYIRAEIPSIRYKNISQNKFLCEYNPYCHEITRDENIPVITSKVRDAEGNEHYVDIKERRLALPFQRLITATYMQHLCGNPMKFTLNTDNPTEREVSIYSNIKKLWKKRNFDGAKYKLALSQLSTGDGGILYYFNENGELSYRLLSFADGYVICSHDDNNGDRVLETVYYFSEDAEYIDCWDKLNHYRFVRRMDDNTLSSKEWELEVSERHGFSEIPLVTKRGDVAWNNGQSIIDNIEIQWNILNVIMKRHGFGILYIKGNYNTLKRGTGDIILNSTNIEGDSSDAKYLEAPSPKGCEDNIKNLIKELQRACSFTALLPDDVHVSGDISGIAIKMMKVLDLEKGLELCQEYQNVANKMLRLFQEGIGIELSNNGKDPNARAEYKDTDIYAEFDLWMPESEESREEVLIHSVAAGIVSRQTATELSMFASSNEAQRLKAQYEEDKKEEIEMLKYEKGNYGNSGSVAGFINNIDNIDNNLK